MNSTNNEGLTGLIFLLMVVVVLSGLWIAPRRLVAGELPPKERQELEFAMRDLLLKILGGVFLFTGAFFTWQQIVIARQNEITDQFSKAVDFLGSGLDSKGNDQMWKRVGGVYFLERIANDWPDQRESVMEVLTSYVRNKCRWADGQKEPRIWDERDHLLEQIHPTPDIRAVLTVIGRRNTSAETAQSEIRPPPSDLVSLPEERRRIDLRQTDLWHADIPGANLRGAWLRRAHLNIANLEQVNLEGARLRDAYLEGATLKGARLQGAELVGAYLGPAKLTHRVDRAILTDADLRTADLTRADLRGAVLLRTKLRGANLDGVKMVGALYDLASKKSQPDKWPDGFDPKDHGAIQLGPGADLHNLDLHGLTLSDMQLQNANLCNTDLENADLTGANLTGASLIGASFDAATKPPTAGFDFAKHGAHLAPTSTQPADDVLRRWRILQ